MEQKELVDIFKKLKRILKEYEGKHGLKPKFNLDSKYDLWSFKKVEIAGREREELYFAGLNIQSSYVGFYFMPVYTYVKLKEIFSGKLLKTLKGKSCFHIKELDKGLKKDIEKALKRGF